MKNKPRNNGWLSVSRSDNPKEGTLNLRQYQLHILGCSITKPGVDELQHCVLGLLGESGEVADLLKKSQYTGRSLDIPHLTEELGDVLWYLTKLAGQLGYSLEEIAQMNYEKLMVRLPDLYPPLTVSEL